MKNRLEESGRPSHRSAAAGPTTSASQARKPAALKVQKARRRLANSDVQRGMAQLRKALCDPARLEIVEALMSGEMSVGEIAVAIDRLPAATSQHLRILRELDLVQGNRRGTSVYYQLKDNETAERLGDILRRLAAPEPQTAV